MVEFGHLGRNRGAFLLWTREAEDVDNMRKRSEPKCVCVCCNQEFDLLKWKAPLMKQREGNIWSSSKT